MVKQEPVCYIEENSFTFYCPLCREIHCITTPHGTNDNPQKPTVYGDSNMILDDDSYELICHFIIVKGMVFYFGENDHNGVYALSPVSQWTKKPKAVCLLDECPFIDVPVDDESEKSLIQKMNLTVKRRKEYKDLFGE